ncbi:MAG: sulfotransferase [Anaerolineaceae bacterium]|nr:sulfotransferase [Anaerolineaceae bacterium]
MHYNLKLFLKTFYKSFFQSKGTHARLTHKRIGFLVLFYIVWPIWGIIVWLSFLLDELFFPSYKKYPIKKPLFIIGNFRSGSTFLQRLIAIDKTQFASARIWDIFLSPSITLTKFYSVLQTIDKSLGGPLIKAFKKFDKRTLGKVDIHKISFFEPEEDENFLLHNWSSFFAGILFPFMKDFSPYIYFDNRLSDKEKTSIMEFYRKIIRRFLFTKDGNLHLLSKNPSFSPKTASIYKYFPDAKIIYLVRNPLNMLPSTISWLGYTWRVFSDPLEKYPFKQEIIKFTKHWYDYPLEILSKSDPASFLIIKYDDLIQNPLKTVQMIYNHFGYSISEEFIDELIKAIENAKHFRSMHGYSLKEMGISKRQVIDTYSEIFTRFNFETKIEGTSMPQDESTLS